MEQERDALRLNLFVKREIALVIGHEPDRGKHFDALKAFIHIPGEDIDCVRFTWVEIDVGSAGPDGLLRL